MTMTEFDQLKTITEYAKLHGVSRQRVWTLIKKKRIPADRVQVGKFCYYIISSDTPWPVDGERRELYHSEQNRA